MYYFASDIHLGAGESEERRRVERLFVEWLDRVAVDADAIFLCGDIFDFWYEYKRVVPKGFVRALAKIAELTDRGVRVVFMAGNHDMWVGDYLVEECGVELYTLPTRFTLAGRVVHVAHGDNLNVTGDWKLGIINKMFRSRGVRWAFSWLLHPDLAQKFGQWWSASSRKRHCAKSGHNTIEGRGVRPLLEYAAQQNAISPCEHYIYGHLHQSLQIENREAGYTVTYMSDWSQAPTFAVLDEEGRMRIEKVIGEL